ncbi:hypothetical protein MC28_F264 (plasmid) [Bacillus thuringiensis MC28]|nr:hypothetical protein MC28_F264 [Bacillus thuringiensis MC28]
MQSIFVNKTYKFRIYPKRSKGYYLRKLFGAVALYSIVFFLFGMIPIKKQERINLFFLLCRVHSIKAVDGTNLRFSLKYLADVFYIFLHRMI